MMDVFSAFSGKTIFFTGVTGFVGKVFLYKLLKEFPDLTRIYVLIRTKKNQSPFERFEKEVLSSQCFDPLRKKLGDAGWKKLTSTIVPLSGDLVEDRLGLNKNDYEQLISDVDFIVHLAATVDFQEKLNISVQMNVLGALKMLTLAQRCQHLEAFVHTSTCYVNWNRPGREEPVKEQLYPLPFDPEEMCKHILSIHPLHVEKETQQLLKKYNFPNTYTFTKNMAEHLLHRLKGKCPVTIVRPSIIGCSYMDPVPGWVDALTAAGGLFLTIGLGIVRELHINPKYVADIIPVDHVCNVIIKALFKTAVLSKSLGVVTASEKNAQQKKPLAVVIPVVAKGPSLMPMPRDVLTQSAHHASPSNTTKPESETSAAELVLLPFIFHAGTSASLNHCTWGVARDALEAYYNLKRHPKALGKADVALFPNFALYRASFLLRREIPYQLMRAVAALPRPVGSEEKQRLVERYGKALARAADMNFQFSPFTSKEWVFDQQKARLLNEHLNERSMAAFDSDPYHINWWSFVEIYNYGILKYILKAVDGRGEPIVPSSGATQFLRASL
jgi:fatty acyl-CoA reductase